MTLRFAEFSVSAQLTPKMVDAARWAIVDGFAVILAGANSEVAVRVADGFVVDGQGVVPVYGSSQQTSPGQAALINAVAGHAYDLDDWEAAANTHPTVVLLPALLAVSYNKPVSGQQLLIAYAVGFELIARLGEAVTLDHYNRGFHSTATIGSIGSAAAVAKLLDLDVRTTANALSIAATQASGFTLQFGTNVKPLQAGFAARNGVEAALLAKAGITANTDIIENERGFAGLFAIAGQPMTKLGDPWALVEHGIALKPWPTCSYAHRLMTAAIELRPKVIDRLHSIVSIEATLPDFHRRILPFDRPTKTEEALFSVPACITKVLSDGDLNLEDLAAKFWERPLVQELIQLVNVNTEPAKNTNLNLDPDQPDRLRIVMEQEVIETTCSFPLGAPSNPISKVQFAKKFIDCSGLTRTELDRFLEWPTCDNVNELFTTDVI